MMCPYSKKAGSTVVEYFEWDLLKVLNPGGAELLKYTDSRRLSSEPDVVGSNRDADSQRFYSEPDAVEYNKDSKPLHDLVLGTKP
jgi:hypothetical protein